MATINLSTLHFNEDAEAGDIVGTLTVTNGGTESFTFTLSSSLGERFKIDGNKLVVKTAGNTLFDFESNDLNDFVVAISATGDQGTNIAATDFDLVVDDVNEAPTGLTVTGGIIAENTAVDAEIASLAGIDQDANSTFTYSLVTDQTGNTAATNAFFKIGEGDKANKVLLKSGLDDAQVGAHTLWVKVTDSGNPALSTVKQVTVTITDTVETATGTSRNDSLVGTIGSDILMGGAGNDKIYGLAGDDVINGGLGKDILVGGAGKDKFVFDTPVKKGAFDQVVDFNVVDDTLQFSLASLKSFKVKALKAGKLNKKFFTVGDKAKDSNDYLYYNKKNGFVYLDSDGAGGKKGIEILKLKPGTAVSADDFLFI